LADTGWIRLLVVLISGVLLATAPSVAYSEEKKEAPKGAAKNAETEEVVIEELPDLIGEDEEDELMDEFALLQEEDIVLTAAKHKQKAGFSPAAVIVITRRDIDESGALTLLELLRRYPAVHVYQVDPLYPSAMVRGTIRVMLTVDGREINLEIFPAPFYALMPITLQEVERMEIILGPNSALYGANAVSTVINIATRRPTGDLHADLFVGGGEHGTSLLHGKIGGGLGPVALQGSVGVERANSWMDRNLITKDLFRANMTGVLRFDNGSLTVSGGALTGGGRFFGMVGYMDFEELALYNSQVEFELGDLKTRAYWYGIRGIFDLEIDLFHPDTGAELGTTPIFDFVGDTFQVEGQYDISLFTNNLLISGVDFRFTSVRSDQIVNPNIVEYRIGIFLHDEHKFLDKLLLTVGARFDWNNRTDPAVSPRVALVYNPTGEHFIRLSGAIAYRRPTLLESSINFRVNANPAFPEIRTLFEEKGTSNPNLNNEILTGVEVGYRGALLDKALRIGADAFLNMNRDWVSFVTKFKFRPPPFNMQLDVNNSEVGYINAVDDFNIVGINFFIEGDLLDELTLYLRGEYRYEWYLEGEREAVKIPNYQGSIGGTLRLPAGLVLNLALNHVDGRSDNTRDPLSILEPNIWQDIPALTYLTANLFWRIDLEDSSLDVGLRFFNPFGGHFRERAGVQAPDGSNFGAEKLDSRGVLTVRYLY
jgi:outer membrane cobalamin receptor